MQSITTTPLLNLQPANDILPPIYGMILDAPGGADGYDHGETLVFSILEEPRQGDIAVLYLNGAPPRMVRLEANLMDGAWADLPFWEDLPHSTVRAVLMATLLGTDRFVVVRLQHVAALHRCLGRAAEMAMAPKVEAVR